MVVAVVWVSFPSAHPMRIPTAKKKKDRKKMRGKKGRYQVVLGGTAGELMRQSSAALQRGICCEAAQNLLQDEDAWWWCGDWEWNWVGIKCAKRKLSAWIVKRKVFPGRRGRAGMQHDSIISACIWNISRITWVPHFWISNWTPRHYHQHQKNLPSSAPHTTSFSND